MKQYIFTLILSLVMVQFATAQNATQVLRGTIIDTQSEMPIIGAAIELLSVENIAGTTTDIDGSFVIEDVPVGRHEIRLSYLGYNTVTIPNILITSGKQAVLALSMEESVIQMEEIVVTAEVEKDKAQNELATISARSFSIEEVTRYSGGRNDASRLAANFAGVNIANDSRNDIVIRGNSPTGVLWRLEGVPIPNPNHFSTLGTTGGPVSALNTNLLKNSDFMTSAFPAEYGNANAGVFDIGLRTGNKDETEFTAQLAIFSGLEAMAEGPLGKNKNSSYVVAYRNSFVELANAVGLNVGTNALPFYKDLTFKIDLGNGKAGKFSFFGLGAMSDIFFDSNEIEEGDLFAQLGIDSEAISQIGIIGMNHRFLLNDNTYIRTTIAATNNSNQFTETRVLEDGVKEKRLDIDDTLNRYVVSSYLNKKVNARFTYRTGILFENLQLDAFLRNRTNTADWIVIRDFEDSMNLLQGYFQSQYKLNPKLTLNIGLHGQFLTYNDTYSIEPRLALNYSLSKNQTLSIGYGMHNQMQPLPIYFTQSLNQGGGISDLNADLDFTEANHFVLAYDLKVGTNWRVKSEAYYQALSDVPVDVEATDFSILNVGADFGFPSKPGLVNEGTGYNYGLEVTVEKFFSQDYYGLLTASLFDSKYKGSDGVERNTAFNNNYTVNILLGKEFKIGKDRRNALTFDTKLTTAGGRYYTPIDKELSTLFGREIRKEGEAYSLQYDPYFRLDVKFGFRLNSKRKKFSQQFYFEFQNLTNNENAFINQYNVDRDEVVTLNQIGFFPDLLYRVQF